VKDKLLSKKIKKINLNRKMSLSLIYSYLKPNKQAPHLKKGGGQNG